jgi:hypothetical protein
VKNRESRARGSARVRESSFMRSPGAELRRGGDLIQEYHGWQDTATGYKTRLWILV